MKPSKYTPELIAEWFLHNIDYAAGDRLSPLKLQKLLYYAQAWSIALFDQPLFEEDFQAWRHGPVVPSIFHKYKEFSYLELPYIEKDIQIEEDTEKLLSDILNLYGEHSAKYLEKLTHREEPWIIARGGLPEEANCDTVIDKEFMGEYYRTLHEQK